MDNLSDIVDDLLEYENPAALVARLVSRYGVAPAQAEALAGVGHFTCLGHVVGECPATSRLLLLLRSGRRLASLTGQS